MARRIHTKSRNGCVECKRRHLKCDETRPFCRKCTFSERQCVYHSTPQDRPKDLVSTPPRTPEHANDINLYHLELFYHFETNTCNTIAFTETQVESYRNTIIRRALSRKFLMHQVLALTACHMSLLRPHSSFYRDMATEHQTSALAGFHELLPNVDASNCLDVLLFAHTIALHTFCDIFNPFEPDFSLIIERLVGCIRLLRGVNVVCQQWWEVWAKTELGALMLQADAHFNTSRASKGECGGLHALIVNADLSSASIKTCHRALNDLQKRFDAENVLDAALGSTHMIFSWLVTASEEYTLLLEQRRPEALILLAYYAVLLHRRRGSWVIGDSGCRLVQHIKSYLGKQWQKWLEWPENAVQEPRDLSE